MASSLYDSSRFTWPDSRLFDKEQNKKKIALAFLLTHTVYTDDETMQSYNLNNYCITTILLCSIETQYRNTLKCVYMY
jgi:hypothetical protein